MLEVFGMPLEIIIEQLIKFVGAIFFIIAVKSVINNTGYRLSKAMRTQVYNYDEVIDNFEKRFRLNRRIKLGEIGDRQKGQYFNIDPRQVTISIPEFIDQERYDNELKKYRIMHGICEAYPEKEADNSLFKLLNMLLDFLKSIMKNK